MASWRNANKAEKEKHRITLGETFEEAGRAKESLENIINDAVIKEIQYSYDSVFLSLYQYPVLGHYSHMAFISNKQDENQDKECDGS